jgi:hypothetical protein
MATQYTSLLGLALPVTGELSGSWGDIVNDSITSLLDSAISGTTSITTDADTTLTTTTGAANQARQAIILWNPASGTTTRNITAPAQSKIYTVINASGGTQSIVFRGAGPTTGVTIVKGESAVVAWNGTDFIKVSNTGGSASFTNVTVTGTTTLSGLTASTALALDASKNVVSVTNTGTGNNVLSASPTLTGTITAAAANFSGAVALGDAAADNITVNGTVTSNLLFTDNTYDIGASGATRPRNLFLAGNATVGGNIVLTGSLDLTNLEVTNIKAKDGTAGMQIADSTGVVSFTANPTLTAGTANGVAYLNGSKVLTTGSALTFDGTNFVNGAGGVRAGTNSGGGGVLSAWGGASGATIDITPNTSSGANGVTYNTSFISGGSGPHIFSIGGSEQMRLTSTGLGIGTSSPASKLHVIGTIGVSTDNAARGQLSWDGTNGLYLNNTDNTPLRFGTSNTERMRLDSSGNLGLGVTPSAWSGFKAFEVASAGSAIWSSGVTDIRMSANMYYNGAYRYAGTGAATRYEQSSGLHAWYTAPSGTAGNAISFTTAMTLDASGNLGVGTTSPTYKLVVSNAGAAGLEISPTGGIGGGGFVQAYNRSSGTFFDFTTYAANIIFATGAGTERARIDSSGNLLVGSTSSSSTSGSGFKVLSPVAGHWDPAVVTSGNSASYSCWDIYSTSAGAYRFYVTTTGVINATSTTISAISDQRLKENIQDLDVGLDKIMALKPRKFDWKDGKGKNIKGDRGWIAQEFEQVFPDMIDTWKDTAPEGEAPYKSVRADLIPVLVKAIQELKAEFDAYKASHP